MLEVTLRPQEPLALGRRSSGSLVTTHRHIPGSVLRGALAQAWIRSHGEPRHARPERQAEFIALFERGVRYGPSFTLGSRIVPISVLRCKYRTTPACSDTLVDQAYEDAGTKTCPVCDGILTASRGAVEFADSLTETRVTRVQLTSDQTAAHGALYSRSELRAPAPFTGHVLGGTDWLTEPRTIWIGGRRSTNGRTSYHAVSAAAPTPAHTDGARLVLRLLSPAILVDDYGRPTDRLDHRMIGDLLGVTVRGVTRAWTRRVRVTGWHAASNLPKPDDLAIEAGSVYELDLAAPPDPEGLRQLLDRGIGLRRTEGFGWIQTGPWNPPPLPTPAAAKPPRAPGILADVVNRTDVSRGTLDMLRNRLTALRYELPGATEDRSLLQRPTVRDLPPDDYRAFEYLLTLDADALAAVIREIELSRTDRDQQ